MGHWPHERFVQTASGQSAVWHTLPPGEITHRHSLQTVPTGLGAGTSCEEVLKVAVGMARTSAPVWALAVSSPPSRAAASASLGVFAFLWVANPRKGRIRKPSCLHESHHTLPDNFLSANCLRLNGERFRNSFFKSSSGHSLTTCSSSSSCRGWPIESR